MDKVEREILNDEVALASSVNKLKIQFLDVFFTNKKKQLFELIQNLPLGSKEQLVDAHHQLKSLNALEVEIQAIVDSGRMAKISLDETKT